MNYEEATQFKEKNIALTGNFSAFLNHTIAAVLVAPDNISLPGIITVYKQTIADGSNELALQNLGYFNGAMNVYVIWEPAKDKIEQMPLSAYLSAAKNG